MEEAAGSESSERVEPVVLPASLLSRYQKFSLYNSPYPAHDRANAVDLYPGDERGAVGSPVAGEVLDTRTVRCPDRSYAVDRDHLIVIDTGDRLARVLHVDPAVEPGETVAVGDPLGELVRSGFFGRWVDNHLHLEFRARDRNPYRASGSLPLVADVDVTPLAWDGTGTVVETGPTHAVLDAPISDGDGTDDQFAAIATDDGRPLDGGCTHYTGGGVPGRAGMAAAGAREGESPAETEPVSLLGTHVGTRRGRHVEWADVAVLANGERVTGLSLFVGRDGAGAKLVTRPDAGDPTFEPGESVTVRLASVTDPVRLG